MIDNTDLHGNTGEVQSRQRVHIQRQTYVATYLAKRQSPETKPAEEQRLVNTTMTMLVIQSNIHVHIILNSDRHGRLDSQAVKDVLGEAGIRYLNTICLVKQPIYFCLEHFVYRDLLLQLPFP